MVDLWNELGGELSNSKKLESMMEVEETAQLVRE